MRSRPGCGRRALCRALARRADRLARAAGLALLLALSVGAGAQAVPVPAAGVGRVDFSAKLQRIDGFGFSEAFGEAAAIERLPEPRRREVLDLLFSRERGAGFSMLRLGIETGSTIEPEAPAGGAAGKPGYVWDGSDLGDGGQVWLARQAKAYGVTQFVADAWMAPAFMKTTGKRIGGVLCGLRDAAVCASGDWRRAYAEYLLAYVGFYRRAGVPVSSLGFSNEPELHVSYESMLFSPAQLAEMLGGAGPAGAETDAGAAADVLRWVQVDAGTGGAGGNRGEPGEGVSGRGDGA